MVAKLKPSVGHLWDLGTVAVREDGTLYMSYRMTVEGKQFTRGITISRKDAYALSFRLDDLLGGESNG